MKTHPRRRASGFTLVELLVVIAIIAVLASAGFAAGNSAMQKARKTQALAAAVAVETAVKSFQTEYGSLPYDGGSGGGSDEELQTNQSSGVKLLNVLLGFEDETGTVLNPRKIKFLTVKEGKGTKGGIIYSSDGKSVTGMYDPWGNPYVINLDTDYDERLQVSPGQKTTNLNGKIVAVHTLGADKTGGTNDDVKTW